MHVIPAIDLLEGKVVRLQKGDYEKVTVYNENAVEEARNFKEKGFNYIHVVDLDGARDGIFTNQDIIKKIIRETGLSVQSGGGIRSYNEGSDLLKKGVQKIICSSLAVKKPGQWKQLIRDFPERVILGLDLKDGKLAYGGWKETSEDTIRSILDPMVAEGLQYVLSTDIARDGMLSGPNIELYKMLKEEFPCLRIIASGGVSGIQDLKALQNMEIYGVVVGKAYYEGRLTLEEMKKYHS